MIPLFSTLTINTTTTPTLVLVGVYTIFTVQYITVLTHFPVNVMSYFYGTFLYILLFYRTYRRTRHAGHCWRSKDEIVSDVLLWTPAYGQSKAGRPARTFILQLCDDMGCNPEDLPKAMNDRETWRERVRDIRASRTSWWWWWLLYIFFIF